jgi:hypothetical protein
MRTARPDEQVFICHDKSIDFRKPLKNRVEGHISITDEQMSIIHSIITGEGGHK